MIFNENNNNKLSHFVLCVLQTVFSFCKSKALFSFTHWEDYMCKTERERESFISCFAFLISKRKCALNEIVTPNIYLDRLSKQNHWCGVAHTSTTFKHTRATCIRLCQMASMLTANQILAEFKSLRSS